MCPQRSSFIPYNTFFSSTFQGITCSLTKLVPDSSRTFGTYSLTEVGKAVNVNKLQRAKETRTVTPNIVLHNTKWWGKTETWSGKKNIWDMATWKPIIWTRSKMKPGSNLPRVSEGCYLHLSWQDRFNFQQAYVTVRVWPCALNLDKAWTRLTEWGSNFEFLKVPSMYLEVQKW